MHQIIILNNKYAKFKTEDKIIIDKLKILLSFKKVGVEYTQAYKNGWNGITCLLKKANTFMLGLLPKVIAFCALNNIPITIVDNRDKLIQLEPINIDLKLKSIGKPPRDYQNRALQASIDNDKGIIRACTGSGKTLIAAMITAKFNKPTIIYVIGLNLLDQFHKLFSEIFEEPIGFIGNGVCDIQKINIASVWTLGRALNIKEKDLFDDDEMYEKENFDEAHKEKIINLLKNTNIHIFDESHVITTNTITDIFKVINPERIYGLSGTPFRDDNSDLIINGILGEKIIDISASELIAKNVLVKPYIKFFNIISYSSSSRNYHDVYREFIVENATRNHIIVEQTQKLLSKGYAPLVLFKILDHGKILDGLFKDAGINFEILSGKDSLEKRLKVIDNFNAGTTDVILSSSIFELGIDVPKISALINGSGSKSSIKTLQKIGRTIRSYPGKNKVAVVEFFDQARYLKEHSKKRMQIYKSESGFEII